MHHNIVSKCHWGGKGVKQATQVLQASTSGTVFPLLRSMSNLVSVLHSSSQSSVCLYHLRFHNLTAISSCLIDQDYSAGVDVPSVKLMSQAYVGKDYNCNNTVQYI